MTRHSQLMRLLIVATLLVPLARTSGGYVLQAQGPPVPLPKGCAGTTAQIDIYPPGPTVKDVIQITPSGEWMTSCAPVYQAHQVTGNVVKIYAASNPFCQLCMQVLTPWEFTVEAGPLPAGTYTVELHLSICSRSPYLYDRTSFTVTHVPVSTVISVDGGELSYHYVGHTTSLAVPPGALSAPSVFTISYHIPPTTTGQLRGMDHFFDLDGTQTVFATPLTLTVSYSESMRGPIVPGTENLYRWQDSQWVADSITLASRCSDGLSAQITHFSLFGVLGESKRVYLPIVLK
jgi:hypothetical protein